MASLSKAFTAVGNADGFSVNDKDSISYAITGTFVATVVLERTRDLQTWEPVLTKSTTATGTYTAEHPGGASSLYRWRCSAYTSGTVTCTQVDVASVIKTFLDASGAVIVSITEAGQDVTGALTVSGAGTFGGNVAVTGKITSSGDAIIGGDVRVTGVVAANVTSIEKDSTGDILRCKCATANIPTGAGYAKGCILIATDGTNHANTLFVNIGNATTANFNAVTIAADV